MSSVDVVIPCYRYGRFLRQCVQSVLAQVGVEIRILIIDDASPDDTAAIATDLATEDRRVCFLQHTKNRGHIATYNEGIDWVSADYYLLLSADDFLLPGALSRATHLMDAHPEVGFSFGKAKTLYERDDPGQRSFVFEAGHEVGWHILEGLEFIEHSRAHCIVATPTAVVRTVLQKRLGGYRPELPHSGDMEMWLRLAAHASVGVLESCQAVYRLHKANMTLDYSQGGWLPDLQQRKAALEYFFKTCSNVLPNEQRLRRSLFQSLGAAAVGFSSAAFNHNNIENSRKLSDFALEVYPEIRRTLAWQRLAFKRCVGRRAWNVLQPSINMVRRWFLG